MLKIINLLFFVLIDNLHNMWYNIIKGYISYLEKKGGPISQLLTMHLGGTLMKKTIFITLASLTLTLSVIFGIITLNDKTDNATTPKAEETATIAPIPMPVVIASTGSSISWNCLFEVNQEGLICNPEIEKELRIYPFSEGLFQYCSIYDIEKYIDILSLETEESILEVSKTLFGEKLAETYDISVVRKKKNGSFKRIKFSKIVGEYTVHHAGFYPRKDCFELYLQSDNKSITIRYHFDSDFKINKIVIKK